MLWLGEECGYASDWVTQKWVELTGRTVDLEANRWLSGPIGGVNGIGLEFFDELARNEGLTVVRAGAPRGLLNGLESLVGPEFQTENLHAKVADFYLRTSEYEIDAWAEWCGAFRPFGRLLAI